MQSRLAAALAALVCCVTSLSGPAFAELPVIRNGRKTVAPGPEDPFAPGPITFGKYKGRKVDGSEVRPLRALTSREAAAYDRKPGETLVANFYHGGQHWIARIPAGAVEDVVFHHEIIPSQRVPIGHGQLEIDLKAGREITLTPQFQGQKPSAARIGQIVATVDAMPPVGVKVSLGWDALVGNFPVAYQLMSLAAKEKIMGADGSQHVVKRFRLDIRAPERQRILRAWLATGTAQGGRVGYELLTRSCNIEATRAVDGGMWKAYSPLRRAAARIVHPVLPFLARFNLATARGILLTVLPPLYPPPAGK